MLRCCATIKRSDVKLRVLLFFGLGGSLLVLKEFPCVVLWGPEALDWVLIPPEALELAYP